ncbi:MAG: DUF359 domain-containing protein [Promethearchaeota archaeon]
MIYRITPEIRRISAVPSNLQGVLFEGSPEIAIPKVINWLKDLSEPKIKNNIEFDIICVGDIVSSAFIASENLALRIKYCFFDGTTQRGRINKLSDLSDRLDGDQSWKNVKFVNPRETISQEIFEFFSRTQQDSYQYLVEIDGEEDLLVVPAVLSRLFEDSEKNHYVFYGQPPITSATFTIPAGCVGIRVTPNVRKIYQNFLEQMKE